MALELVYDSKFKANILAVRRTSCGKTSFVQRLCVNNIFGELEKIEWVSKIELSEQREAQTQYCFSFQFEFHYPHSVDDSDNLMKQFFKKNRESAVDNVDSFFYSENVSGQK